MPLLFLSALSLPKGPRNDAVGSSNKKIRTACIAAPSKRARSQTIVPSKPSFPSFDVSTLDTGRPRRRMYPMPEEERRRLVTEKLRKRVQREVVERPLHHRKPHGYWNQLTNVERELMLVNAQLGRQGRRVMPRVDDLKMLSRGDLLAGLMKHGGMRHVAAALRWSRPTARDGIVRPVRPVRQKLLRRPSAYWTEVSRVHSEMSAFIDEFGTRGVMPTRKQLYAFGRSDLANAAMRHGGLRVIARQMELKCRKRARPRGFWRDFTELEKIVVEFSKAHCPGKMPTADELSSKGFSCIVNAMAAHGGFPAVADKCGLKPRNVKRQGAPLLWNEIRVRREYLSFIMTYYPHLAKERIMVGERQLRQHGRNDLSYAIGKFGGFGKLASALDLKKRVFRRTRTTTAANQNDSESTSDTSATTNCGSSATRYQ